MENFSSLNNLSRFIHSYKVFVFHETENVRGNGLCFAWTEFSID